MKRLISCLVVFTLMLSMIPAAFAADPLVVGDTRVNGYYDEEAALKMELVARHNSEAMSEDGGSLEIVQYNPTNGYAYAVSGVKKRLIAINLNGDLSGETVVNLDGTEYDIEALIAGSLQGFTYKDMTSVAVSPDGSKLAVTVQEDDYTANGIVVLFTCGRDGSLELRGTVYVGVQPDMLVFADDNTILTADEAEPRGGVNGADPKGSVSIVTIAADNTMTAEIVYFDKFNDQRAVLTTAGALIQKNTQPSTDFEPEYIAVSGGKAYISLQEANAVAVLDIAAKDFVGVHPLGFQDYGSSKVDLQKNGNIEIRNYSGVYGIRMPDGIAAAVMGGKTYILTANEGDSRSDWEGLDNEVENKTSPSGKIEFGKKEKVVWFNTAMWDGLDTNKDYIFGSRSFSIYEATDNGLLLKYDSGSDFEEITAAKLPEYFNCSNKNIEKDNRSGKKGPEPESVVTGVVGGKTYAFIALERIGGVMVYDISKPEEVQFVNYINSREFGDKIQGDVSPEGLCFVSESDSKTGKALLLAACEVSGTLAVYELSYEQPEQPEQPETPGSGSDSDDDSDDSAPASDPGSDKASENEKQEEQKQNPFEDVLADAYYYDAVLWAAGEGVTAGTDATHFSPDDACTRAQAMTFLWKALGSPAPESGNMPFGDVAAGSYYYDAVLWAFESGITAGTGASSFGPDEKCTRAQAMTFLWKALGSPAPESGNMPFGDVAAGSYYYDAVLWAFENGITAGTSASNFSPDGECNRAQIVTFLWRAIPK